MEKPQLAVDSLNYDEPWGIGGLLSKKAVAEEAKEVHCEDLRQSPKNPWSTKGLMRCLGERLGDADSKTMTAGRDWVELGSMNFVSICDCFNSLFKIYNCSRLTSFLLVFQPQYSSSPVKSTHQ